MQLTIALIAPLLALAAAAPADLQRRDEATCGKQHYTSDAVSAASSAACDKIGGNSRRDSSVSIRAGYPHEYHNYEGFDFKGLDGPFYEFPILSSGKIYSSGSPGADRVIITKKCEEAGVITHTGASGNNFVACEGTS